MLFDEAFDDVTEVLEQAEANASSAKEITFVSDMVARVEKDGDDATITEGQAEWLRRVARMN